MHKTRTGRNTVAETLLALELLRKKLASSIDEVTDTRLTDDETGPSCAEVPFAVKLTPLGVFSLTSRAAGPY